VNAVLPAVEYFEGPNEYDISGNQNWAQDLFNYQKALYQHPARGNTMVVGPSLVQGQSFGVLAQLGIGQYLDYGNVHSYPGGKIPTNNLQYNIDMSHKISQKPILSTETGYHTDLYCCQPGVSELAHGKYTPRLFFEYLNNGIQRAYIYELINEHDKPTDMESNYGLLRNNGSAKPAFIAVRNLIQLLKDPQNFTPSNLDVTISSATTVHHTLLQKSNGTFFLALWNEVSSYDTDAKKDISNPPVSATVNVPRSFQVSIYSSFTNNQPTLKNLGLSNSIQVDVSDEVIVVQLS